MTVHRAATRTEPSQRSVEGVVLVAAPEVTSRLTRSLKAEGLRVVARGATPEQLSLEGNTQPAAIVVHAPDLGSEVVAQVRRLRKLAPDSRVVLVTPAANLQRVRVLLAEGVDAFVLDSDARRNLGLAVRSACQGLLSFPESIRGTLVRPVLSSREKQVLGLVVLGLTNDEIARKLHLSESTVKSHLSSAFTKLGARSRSEAAALILDPNTGLGTGILAIANGE